MVVYTVIMFVVGSLFITIGVAIYKGNTNLIHSYHQTRVTDFVGYAKAMGKSVGGIGVSAILSGILSLFPNMSDAVPTVIFMVGFAICFLFIYLAQKKYNGGMF